MLRVRELRDDAAARPHHVPVVRHVLAASRRAALCSALATAALSTAAVASSAISTTATFAPLSTSPSSTLPAACSTATLAAALAAALAATLAATAVASLVATRVAAAARLCGERLWRQSDLRRGGAGHGWWSCMPLFRTAARLERRPPR